MAEARHTSFQELRNLMDPSFVRTKKIECIKLLRQISGDGLRETKDFFEQEWQPYVLNKPTTQKTGKIAANFNDVFEDAEDTEAVHQELPPPMYLVGHSYKQLDKCVVLILGVSSPNTSYETVYSLDSDGNIIHRYNRRDFGRVTGTSHETPDPRNLEKL